MNVPVFYFLRVIVVRHRRIQFSTLKIVACHWRAKVICCSRLRQLNRQWIFQQYRLPMARWTAPLRCLVSSLLAPHLPFVLVGCLDLQVLTLNVLSWANGLILAMMLRRLQRADPWYSTNLLCNQVSSFSCAQSAREELNMQLQLVVLFWLWRRSGCQVQALDAEADMEIPSFDGVIGGVPAESPLFVADAVVLGPSKVWLFRFSFLWAMSLFAHSLCGVGNFTFTFSLLDIMVLLF